MSLVSGAGGQPEPQSIALPGGLVGAASSSQTTGEGGALASSQPPSGCSARGELCPDGGNGDSLGGRWSGQGNSKFVCLCCLPLGCLPNLGSENLDLSPFSTSLLVLCLHSLGIPPALCVGRSLHWVARWVVSEREMGSTVTGYAWKRVSGLRSAGSVRRHETAFAISEA